MLKMSIVILTCTHSFCSCGLPRNFKPPEVCISLGRIKGIDGIAFDIWSFGILALYTWTRIPTDLGKPAYWTTDIYPLLFQSLRVSVALLYTSLKQNTTQICHFSHNLRIDLNIFHSFMLLPKNF